MTGEEITPTEPTNDAAVAAVDTPVADTSEADMGAIFDRLVTNNGADRAPDGKFAAPGGGDGTKAVAASSGDRGASPGEEGAGASSEPPSATPAPAHLPGAIKAHWDKYPPEAQAAIAAHQSEMDRKFGEIGKQYGAVKPLADRLAEAAKYPDFAGMTPDQIAQGAVQLAAVQVNLNKNPVGTILDIAKHYNVLPQLAQAFGGQAGEQDQLVTGLQQKIANLEQQLSKVSNPDTIRETVSKTLQERETEATVQKFAAKDGIKDYWADVEADMPTFIKLVLDKGQEKDSEGILQAAYDMAINANPDVRAKVRAAEAKATAPAQDPKKAAAVRNAVSINVKSSNSGKERVMTEQEAMGAAWDRVMAS